MFLNRWVYMLHENIAQTFNSSQAEYINRNTIWAGYISTLTYKLFHMWKKVSGIWKREYFTILKGYVELDQSCFRGKMKLCNQKVCDKVENSKELDSKQSKTKEFALKHLWQTSIEKMATYMSRIIREAKKTLYFVGFHLWLSSFCSPSLFSPPGFWYETTSTTAQNLSSMFIW